ncbi:maestro heat-like repeat family member 5 [Tachyglossus aculeatus]|uniref:maestro heat-like repeat family member 5 n=1 Tax=Tachyglossus aculeatus TaxID=9261 RepID=UPI0018F3437A|nr:maestro heat-like repeat family member 5 [Tachyglossus aculeatus]
MRRFLEWARKAHFRRLFARTPRVAPAPEDAEFNEEVMSTSQVAPVPEDKEFKEEVMNTSRVAPAPEDTEFKEEVMSTSRVAPTPEDTEFKEEVMSNGKEPAVNTLYELLFAVEYSVDVAQLLPQLFLAFIIQIQYVLELGLVGERVLLAVEPTVPSALSPWRTALEALRGLLFTRGCWQIFIAMELQDGWHLFSSLNTFQEAVALLARGVILVQSRCRMVAELLQMVASSLQEKDPQGRSVAMGLLSELIWTPGMKTVLDPKVVRFIFRDGLKDPDPVVRVISLQALTSLPLNHDKVRVLLAQLPFLLEGITQNNQEGLLVAMDAATLSARSLGSRGLGHLFKDIVLMLNPFFDDERPQVRVAALELLEAVASSCVTVPKSRLGQKLICCLLPVLFHLKDEHPTVAKKARCTFFWLAQNIGWRDSRVVGWKLRWEERESRAYGTIWTALMKSFGDFHPIFLSQALAYTNCIQPDVKFAAVVFLVHTITLYPASPLLS